MYQANLFKRSCKNDCVFLKILERDIQVWLSARLLLLISCSIDNWSESLRKEVSLSNPSLHLILKNVCEGIGVEFVAGALVELVLELNPVKSQGVKEALHGVHAHEDAKSDGKERKEWQK